VNPITTGLAPWEPQDPHAAGLAGQNMSGVALTGLTNNLIVIVDRTSWRSVSNINGPDTCGGWSTTLAGFVENLDGSIIVPPVEYWALLATHDAMHIAQLLIFFGLRRRLPDALTLSPIVAAINALVIDREPFTLELYEEVLPLAAEVLEENTRLKAETCAYYGERDFKIDPDLRVPTAGRLSGWW